MKLLKTSGDAEIWGPHKLYAVALRPESSQFSSDLQAWPHALHVGETLPTLPLWLSETHSVPLDLEASYEETCGVLQVK
jgi:hypothetical protein